MKKINLDIIALSNSVNNSPNYAVILAERGGNRKLPIVIGTFEAQAIVVTLEGLKVGRPLTHDLFHNFIKTFEINVIEVLIYKMEEGIFYAQLVCEKDGKIEEIDARTSDSLALAVRTGCPIYIYEDILNRVSLSSDHDEFDTMLTDEDEDASDINLEEHSKLEAMTLEELEDLLQQVLEQEDYDLAIAIRDEINKRK